MAPCIAKLAEATDFEFVGAASNWPCSNARTSRRVDGRPTQPKDQRNARPIDDPQWDAAPSATPFSTL